MRKSRREKEQEAAEAKKREEEANAAKAYAEFLDAFEGEDAGRKKAGSSFVKAGTESTAAYTPAPKHAERQSHGQGAFGSNRVCNTFLRCSSLRFLCTTSLRLPHLTLHPSPKEREQWTHFLKKLKSKPRYVSVSQC